MLQYQTDMSTRIQVVERTHPNAGTITSLVQARAFRDANFGKDVTIITEDGNGFIEENHSSAQAHCKFFNLQLFRLD